MPELAVDRCPLLTEEVGIERDVVPVDINELLSVLSTIKIVEKRLSLQNCCHDHDYKFISQCGNCLVNFARDMDESKLCEEVFYGLFILARFAQGASYSGGSIQDDRLTKREIDLRSQEAFMGITGRLFEPWKWEFGLTRSKAMEKLDELMGIRSKVSDITGFSKKQVDGIMSESLFTIPAVEKGVSDSLHLLYHDVDGLIGTLSMTTYGMVLDRWVAENVTHDTDEIGRLHDRTDARTIIRTVEAIYQLSVIRDVLARKLDMPTRRSSFDTANYASQGTLFMGGEEGVDIRMCDEFEVFGDW